LTVRNEAKYWLMPTPPAFDAPFRGGGASRRNIAMTFDMKNLEWCGYPTVTNSEDTFIRFDRIHERDRRTPHDGISSTCIALRGINGSGSSVGL